MPGCLRRSVAVPLLCTLFLSIAGCGKKEEPKATMPSSAAQLADKPRVRETNVAGVVAEFTECKRKDGVLTVQIRLRNTGTKPVTLYPVTNGNYDAYYVIAEDKKYFVLRDENKTPLSPTVNPSGSIYVSLAPEGTWLWWAKYPAPPAAVKAINYITSVAGPFDDIPISDQ
jgi:hypothetical protein